jgi:hypothetical protein
LKSACFLAAPDFERPPYNFLGGLTRAARSILSVVARRLFLLLFLLPLERASHAFLYGFTREALKIVFSSLCRKHEWLAYLPIGNPTFGLGLFSFCHATKDGTTQRLSPCLIFASQYLSLVVHHIKDGQFRPAAGGSLFPGHLELAIVRFYGTLGSRSSS